MDDKNHLNVDNKDYEGDVDDNEDHDIEGSTN